MPDFAVAIYPGRQQPEVGSRPESFQLWSEFCLTAKGHIHPFGLIEIELQLRSGRAWQDPEGRFTLLWVKEGSAAGKFVWEMIIAMKEAKGATRH